MNYAETLRWHKSGSFSGSGMGIGASGPGIGIGGGSYSERGEMKSKRADVFDEPARFALPVLSLIVAGCVVAGSINAWPSLISMLLPDGPEPASPPIETDLPAMSISDIVYLIPFLAFGVVIVFCIWAWKNHQEEARLNAEVLPRQISRYNRLLYCDTCNLLYDAQGRSEVGSESGFKRMIQE